MVGGTTQATAAPAVRRERLDTTQRTVWGFFMRRRIRDRSFSPRPGRNGPNRFLTFLITDPFDHPFFQKLTA